MKDTHFKLYLVLAFFVGYYMPRILSFISGKEGYPYYSGTPYSLETIVEARTDDPDNPNTASFFKCQIGTAESTMASASLDYDPCDGDEKGKGEQDQGGCYVTSEQAWSRHGLASPTLCRCDHGDIKLSGSDTNPTGIDGECGVGGQAMSRVDAHNHYHPRGIGGAG